ncbi:Mediator of RNA polymerase II transcription subunit 1.1 [Toxocara canis]|uniref:Mediator of RNA polymerase II transcription subunit 1.1 n=1 Tax=Toxocara canis TaxID=6265 RepID=A0A0B2V6G4_TOXCA|nr:Mediator of RNA polymerase II transcription subunit 1.1 [Toxocara canis]
MEEMLVECADNEQGDSLLNGEFDLEKIEEEIRMEKIRQAASKHSWDNFSLNLRKNLMEKRIVLDADDREDVQNALSDLRKHMPADEGGDLAAHLRHLADILQCDFQAHTGCYKLKSADLSIELGVEDAHVSSCTVSWFGERAVEANTLKKLIAENKWGTIHNTLSVMLRLLPPNLQREEKCICMRSLELMEKDLLNASMSSMELIEKDLMNLSSTSLPLVDKINAGMLALCQPRTESSPFTIHLLAEPSVFFNVQSGTFVNVNEQAISDGSFLPCAQLSIVTSPTPQLFSDTPLLSAHGEWRTVESGCRLPAAFCLRFSRPIIFCADSLKKLSSVAAVPLVVEGGLNIYEYLFNEDDAKNDILVSLPGCPTQRYVLDQSMLCFHDDGIVREVTFMHPRDVVVIVDTVRAQLAHNALFESLVRAHNPNASLSNAIEIRLTSASVYNFDLIFNFRRTAFIARVNVPPAKMSVSLECIATGGILPETHCASSILAKSWSLGVMMRGVLRRGGAGGMQTPSEEAVLEMKENSNNNVIADGNDDVKVSQCWLPVANTTQQHAKRCNFEFIVADEGTSGGTRSLLTLFKELDQVDELIPPPAQPPGSLTPSAPPRIGEMLAPRTSRIHSENTMTINALSDLDAICDMAANIDDGESNVSEHSGRSSIVERCSPSAVEAQRLRAQVPPQSPSSGNDRYRGAQMSSIPQLSPLEIARQRLAQQTPLSNAADVFEFDDPPRMAPTSAFATSPQFQFPGGVQGSYQFPAIQPARGSMSGGAPLVKRRGRGRKAGSMGDRTGDHATTLIDPNTGFITTTTSARRPRGTATTRRPRRPRKAAQLAASQTHTHQFAIDRPLLQRSFSDVHYSAQISTAATVSNRSETVSEVDGLEESSDEETDPPPPTRLTAPPPTTTTSTAASVPQVTPTPASSCSPAASTKPTTTGSVNSAASSIASSSGSTEANTPVGTSPSAATTAGHSAGATASYQTSKSRKSSLEAVVGKLHCKSSGSSATPASNPYAASDLYDDESEPVSKPQESPATKREGASTPLASASPGARASPSARATPTSSAEQPISDLKIMIKLKQQPTNRSSTPQYPSTISPPSRLTGQPPSSSRSREEKALLRQRQLKEKARMQEERSRKSTKRERKSDSSGSSKKAKLERPPIPVEQKASRVELPPQVPAFASLKNFKIPKRWRNINLLAVKQQVALDATVHSRASVHMPSTKQRLPAALLAEKVASYEADDEMTRQARFVVSSQCTYGGRTATELVLV